MKENNWNKARQPTATSPPPFAKFYRFADRGGSVSGRKGKCAAPERSEARQHATAVRGTSKAGTPKTRKSILKICTGILLLFVVGCTEKALSPKDYIEWVKQAENGLLKSKKISPLNIEVMYRPPEYIIALESANKPLEQSFVERRKEELETLQYYLLRLSVLSKNSNEDVTNWGVESPEMQEERMRYLSFGMEKDIYLVEDGDTLFCILYHFERSYDIAPFRNFLVAFKQDKKHTEKDKVFILNSSVFKTGIVKFKFEAQKISNIPNLKTI